jgi:hypothetical protein
MNLAAVSEYRALSGKLLSGAEYTDDEFDRYVELGLELSDDPESAGLAGISLGKKKKGFFKKITKGLKSVIKPISKVVKKALKVVAPVLKTVVGAVMSRGGGMSAAGDAGAEVVEQDPNAAMAMAALTTGVDALTAQGIQMPPDIAAANALSQQALQNAANGQQYVNAATKPLLAAGMEEETPVVTYVVAGVAGLAVLGAAGLVMLYAVSEPEKKGRKK